MKNKIFAIMMLICVFVSIVPISVFADTYTLKQLYEQEYIGTKHTFNYYAPNGWENVYILNTNKGIAVMFVEPNHTISYYNESLGLIQNDQKEGMYYTYFETIEDAENFVFNGSIDSIDMTYSREIVAYQIIAYTKSVAGNYTGNAGDTSIVPKTFEKFYEDNVYSGNSGNYESMIGEYYLIVKQEIQLVENSFGRGYVETMDYVEFTPDDNKYVYVVISTNDKTGDFIDLGASGLDDVAKIQRLLIELGLVNGIGLRNNYHYVELNGLFMTHRGHIFYNRHENINRYYFNNLTDACKFVLYGTEGAQYEYKEICATNYGYGYYDCIYNNYEISTSGINPLSPMAYPLGQAEIILRWHDENVYDRDYLHITYDYYPLSSLLGTDNILRISNQLNPVYKATWKNADNESTFNAYDTTIYEETYAYDYPALQHFYIYSPNLQEDYHFDSWDVIWSSHDIYAVEKTDGGISVDTVLKNQDKAFDRRELKTDNNLQILHDIQNNVYYIYGDETAWVWDETEQGYKNPDTGEIIKPGDTESLTDEWFESIIDYQNALFKLTEVIDDFTNELNKVQKEIKQLTDLFNAFLSNIPSLWKRIIFFSLTAVIIMRITRRK